MTEGVRVTRASGVYSGVVERRRPLVPAVSGLVFVPVFVVGLLMALNSPDTNASDAKWRAWYADSSNRTQMIIGAYLLIISAVLFVGFVAGLRERVGGTAAARWFLTATGIGFAVLVMVGAIASVGVAGNISFGDAPVPQDADLLRNNIGFPFIFVAGALSAAAFIATVAVLARAVGFFATWLTWVSFVLAVILLAAVIFLPMAALPIWVLVVSIFLLRSPTRTAAVAAQADVIAAEPSS